MALHSALHIPMPLRETPYEVCGVRGGGHFRSKLRSDDDEILRTAVRTCDRISVWKQENLKKRMLVRN